VVARRSAGSTAGSKPRSGCPVELGSPFDRWDVKDTVYGPEDLKRVGPSLATAVGLALGGLE
jgi:hypothetical protein